MIASLLDSVEKTTEEVAADQGNDCEESCNLEILAKADVNAVEGENEDLGQDSYEVADEDIGEGFDEGEEARLGHLEDSLSWVKRSWQME
jgi:hypothetical protein